MEILTDSAEVPLPARAAAARSRGGTVAVPTEPGALGGEHLGRLHGRPALLGHGGSASKDNGWLKINTGMKSSGSAAYKAYLLLSK